MDYLGIADRRHCRVVILRIARCIETCGRTKAGAPKGFTGAPKGFTGAPTGFTGAMPFGSSPY